MIACSALNAGFAGFGVLLETSTLSRRQTEASLQLFSVGSRDLDLARVSVYARQLEPLPKMRDRPAVLPRVYIRKRAPISTRFLDPPRRAIGELIAPL